MLLLNSFLGRVRKSRKNWGGGETPSAVCLLKLGGDENYLKLPLASAKPPNHIRGLKLGGDENYLKLPLASAKPPNHIRGLKLGGDENYLKLPLAYGPGGILKPSLDETFLGNPKKGSLNPRPSP